MIKDEDNRREHQKMRDKWAPHIRFSVSERAMLENLMAAEGWENVSGFIKYKLFGSDEDEELERQIDTRDPAVIATFLLKSVLELTDVYMYVKYRYDKDMNQLYREEGVDVNEWKKATNKWLSELTKRTETHLTLIRRIADSLGLENYTDLPSDHMDIDPDTATTEQMDALAHQLWKERTAMGYNK